MILLSYPLGQNTPHYGGQGNVLLKKEKCLEAGDSCNTATLSFSNHAGTHIDCPKHFAANGKCVTDFAAPFWFTCQVVTATLPKTPAPAALLGIDDLQKALGTQNKKNARALLLKTGWYQHRYDATYWENPPGFQPDVADFLRETFPLLDFFGFDLISLSSFAHREIGRQAHRCFLDRPDPILIVEDMDLLSLPPTGIANLLISPLFVTGADGVPCTIWANLDVPL